MVDTPSEREILHQRLRVLDEALDNLTRESCPFPYERAQLRIRLRAEYARVVKLLDQTGSESA